MIHKLSFCEVHTVIIYKDTNNTECQRSYVVWYISVEYSHIRVTTAKAKPSQLDWTLPISNFIKWFNTGTLSCTLVINK